MTRWLLLGVVWVGLVPSVAAEVTVIYRKADQVVAGIVYPGQPVATELQNILRSDLGGSASDYATVTTADPQPGERLTITPAGKVVRTRPLDTARQDAAARLKASLSLTDQDLADLKMLGR